MTTKLTLSIDKEIVEKSKRYAASQNRSLSDVVESYLRSLEAPSEITVTITPRVKALRGAFKAPPGFNYKKELKEAILRKHG